MNAEQFCAEYGHECKNGRISFSKRIVDKFITIYTHLTPNDFNKEMRKRLIISVMIDMHKSGYSIYQNREDHPIEKIELPKFIFE